MRAVLGSLPGRRSVSEGLPPGYSPCCPAASRPRLRRVPRPAGPVPAESHGLPAPSVPAESPGLPAPSAPSPAASRPRPSPPSPAASRPRPSPPSPAACRPRPRRVPRSPGPVRAESHGLSAPSPPSSSPPLSGLPLHVVQWFPTAVSEGPPPTAPKIFNVAPTLNKKRGSSGYIRVIFSLVRKRSPSGSNPSPGSFLGGA
ncbi:vegetative cell wall protein gp1-like [Oryx dammah]|uniref:vegetative cell wall protein gp1-like n=1 Tax=Oryx dammah TaxID=59534 RepID=UPI001A9BC59B|nr:vegetative cell wall protein gp1-like [Oryx dammah]